MVTTNDWAAWLKGGKVNCSFLPGKRGGWWLGAPGVGKGTQAELLAQKLGACHLSTGDVFRAAKCLADHERTPAIDSTLNFMRRGDLVPDMTVLDMVAYESSTRRLIDFYRERGLLVSIAADATPQETFRRSIRMLNEVVAPFLTDPR